jgi:hypothetical protein
MANQSSDSDKLSHKKKESKFVPEAENAMDHDG